MGRFKLCYSMSAGCETKVFCFLSGVKETLISQLTKEIKVREHVRGTLTEIMTRLMMSHGVCLECEDGSAETAAGEQQTHQRWTRPQSSCRSSPGTQTHTHVLWGHSISVMVLILYILYFLSPYTNPTPKPTFYRKLSAFLDFHKT